MIKSYPPVNRETIWNFRQNNPELVIQDAREYIGLNDDQCEVLRTILLARGVNKWLKVRRDIIAYKTLLKIEIKESMMEINQVKESLRTADERRISGFVKHYHRVKERLKTLERIRGNLRKLCHSDRLVYWPRSISRRVLKQMNSVRVGVNIQ